MTQMAFADSVYVSKICCNRFCELLSMLYCSITLESIIKTKLFRLVLIRSVRMVWDCTSAV